MFDAQLTRILPGSWSIIAETAKESTFWLTDESDFCVVRARRGRKRLVFPEEVKPLHPPAGEVGQPRIKELLARAFEWQARLRAEPNLTQTSLAKETGVSRVRVTQILNLTRLAPEIQSHIHNLTATAKRAAVSENQLRSITGLPQCDQWDAFSQLAGLPLTSNRPVASTATA